MAVVDRATRTAATVFGGEVEFLFWCSHRVLLSRIICVDALPIESRDCQNEQVRPEMSKLMSNRDGTSSQCSPNGTEQ
jgi:hypothetical protein